MPLQFSQFSRISRKVPQALADGGEAEERISPYGDQHVVVVSATKHVLVDEGSYVCATNPTPSTAVAYGSAATQTSFSDTVGFLVWQNGWNPSDPNAKRMKLDFLKILVSGTVPASSTSTQCAIKIDSGNRTPTANFTAITPVNANMATNLVGGKLWCPNAGTITIPAAVNARLIERFSLKFQISITLEEYRINFGSIDGNSISSGASAGFNITAVAPVVLNPGDYAILHLWQPAGATNALSFEFTSTWYER